MSIWAWLWLAWLVALLVIELTAARKAGTTTLSEHLWRVFGIKNPHAAWWLKWTLRAGLILMTLHLGWGLLG